MTKEAAEVKVSILVEDSARKGRLWAEHGLSLLVEVRGRKILFDTGQSGEVLLHNSRELGLSLKGIDSIVLSHGHYDHTGGLASLLKEVSCVDLYAHPDAFERKYIKAGINEVKEIGSPLNVDTLIRSGVKLYLERKSVTLGKGILLTGEIPSNTDFEQISSEFLAERNRKLMTISSLMIRPWSSKPGKALWSSWDAVTLALSIP